jgi:Na+/H+-dicarboxylate symporter
MTFWVILYCVFGVATGLILNRMATVGKRLEFTFVDRVALMLIGLVFWVPILSSMYYYYLKMENGE